MKKGTKTRYRVDIYMGDTMLETSIDLTQKDYKRILSELMQQHRKHDDSSQEFYTEHEYKIMLDDEKHTVTKHVFSYSVNEFYLWMDTCKKGYCFK